LGICGLGLIGSSFVPNFFMIWRACTYTPVFWLGLKLRQKNLRLIKQIPWFFWILVDVLVFLTVTYVLKGTSIFIKLLLLGGEFILHILGAVMAFVLLQKIANKLSRWKENRVFMRLSKYSMSMYLLHQQVIYFCIAILNGILNPYLHAGVNFFISMVVSFLISAILMRFKITRFLIGEKH
jgi:peptidoglycan/LPS O-acetylase OafA/YrhL